jgi:hypothetical protein
VVPSPSGSITPRIATWKGESYISIVKAGSAWPEVMA